MSPNQISRRELLKWASAGAGAAAVGSATYLFGRDDPPERVGSAAVDSAPRRTQVTAAPPQTTTAAASTITPAAPGERLLVVVEMDGGNDGLSMLVPYGLRGYYDLRSSTAIGESDVLAIDDEVGLHGELTNLHRRGAAVIQGIGSNQPDGSHFEMMARWWSGTPDGVGRFTTGFLGRLADAIGDPAAPAVALSIGSGSHPALIAEQVTTLSIPSSDAAWYVAGATEDDPARFAFQRGLAAFGSATGRGGYEDRLRRAWADSITFGNVLLGGEDDGSDRGYPGSALGNGLRLAADLFAGGTGVRIVHVPMQQDFDTHDDHAGRYPYLMQDLDDSLEAFLADLESRGLSDRVLVMTTSEFGRTAHDNASGGLDHGTASHALLLGPVNAGRFGEHPSLTELDDNNDLVATAPFDRYYATVAEGWFGVPASDVLDGDVEPFEGVIAG